MKSTLKSVIAAFGATALLFTGCSTFDDTEINSRVDDLENRVTELETLVKQFNANIQDLQTIVEALEGSDVITSVEPTTDGDGGFIVTFQNHGAITVTNGHSAAISVRQDSDGIYYWTIDGEYLLVDGAKVPATAEYGAPQMRINSETKEFEFSTDNGVTWTPCGDVATSGIGTIKDVVKGEDSVDFTLYDDSVISIPMVQSFALDIAITDYGVAASGSVRVDYTVIEGDENTVVKVVPEGGFTAEVNGDHESGYIELTAPAEVPAATTILVVAVNGKGEMTGKLLNIEKGILTLVKNSAVVGKDGGEFSINISTNFNRELGDYMVQFGSPADMTWIHEVPATKATHIDEIKYTVDPLPEGTESRTSTISVIGQGERLEFTLTQVNEVIVSGGAADFGTYTGSGTATIRLAEGVTEAGWTMTNVLMPSSTNWAEQIPEGEKRPALMGSSLYTGVISSPALTGGCGILSVKYGIVKTYANFCKNGVSFKVDVKSADGSQVLATQTVTESAVTAATLYSKDLTFNQSGDFIIELTNLKPSGGTSGTVMTDAVIILDVSWTGYSE